MINSLRFYRLHSDWPETEEDLLEQLSAAVFIPCGSFSEKSLGLAPVTPEGDELARRVAGCDWFESRLQSRVLPAAAIKEALVDRVAQFQGRTGREPSRAEQRELKDEVYAELLPKALLKSQRWPGFYLSSEKIIAIATASANQAEDILDKLRGALGSLQVVPLAFKRPMRDFLTRIFMGDGPDAFFLGRDCRMRDPSDTSALVNWYDMDLAASSVRNHVKRGMIIDRLGVSFDAVLQATLDEEIVLRKLKFEGLAELDELDAEEPLARQDAEWTIVTGLITQLLRALKKELGGYA